MNNIEALERDRVYHIYNRGNNSETIFIDDENRRYFLKLYKKHISPIVDTYAYCLLGNHFHFVVRVKNIDEVDKKIKIKEPSQYFANFFNAYTKAFNKQNGRHGSLFEKPFHRKRIISESYLKDAIIYVNNNAVNHDFVRRIEDWKWSSYNCTASEIQCKIDIDKETVIDTFDDKENFIFMHKSFKYIPDELSSYYI